VVGVGGYGTSLRLAAPGGEIVSVPLPPIGSLDTAWSSPGGASFKLGPINQIEAALPSGVTNEVVVDFSTVQSYGCGLPAPIASYLMDDLRVE